MASEQYVDGLELYIAELKAKLRTMSELEEQYLREIDRQAERIKELEQIIDNHDETVERAPAIISDLEMDNWKLKFQVERQAEHIARLEAKLTPEQLLDVACGTP